MITLGNQIYNNHKVPIAKEIAYSWVFTTAGVVGSLPSWLSFYCGSNNRTALDNFSANIGANVCYANSWGMQVEPNTPGLSYKWVIDASNPIGVKYIRDATWYSWVDDSTGAGGGAYASYLFSNNLTSGNNYHISSYFAAPASTTRRGTIRTGYCSTGDGTCSTKSTLFDSGAGLSGNELYEWNYVPSGNDNCILNGDHPTDGTRAKYTWMQVDYGFAQTSYYQAAKRLQSSLTFTPNSNSDFNFRIDFVANTNSSDLSSIGYIDLVSGTLGAIRLTQSSGFKLSSTLANTPIGTNTISWVVGDLVSIIFNQKGTSKTLAYRYLKNDTLQFSETLNYSNANTLGTGALNIGNFYMDGTLTSYPIPCKGIKFIGHG